MNTLSLDAARALLAGAADDRRRLEAAVARAMPHRFERHVLKCDCHEDMVRWQRGTGDTWEAYIEGQDWPPAYLSDDPRLNDEMFMALPRDADRWSWRIQQRSEGWKPDGGPWWECNGWWSTHAQYRAGTPSLVYTQGATLAEALVLALAAAEMLKEDDDGTA